MKDPRRFFTSRQRVALYLAADGRCEMCGVELERGWHGDHFVAHSKGGETDVINGQALCPRCNSVVKGDRVTSPWSWQRRALRMLERTDGDFLCVVTPGAGKTFFALMAAQQLIDQGSIRRVIVVVPTSHLRRQWANAAADAGIQLDNNFANGHGAFAKDFHGTVVTYQSVASQPELFRRLSSHQPTLVILDEVHHGGHTMTWGTALRDAFEDAARRVLLSGTPSRTDRNPVPFVEYNDDGFIASFIYTYGEAVRDQVVRPVEFLSLDGAVSWKRSGSIVSIDLTGADDDTYSIALRSALAPDGEWIGSVLRRADDELTRHRLETPDAGGLVVATDQYHARAYASLLQKITGHKATLAISDEPDSSERIARFASGSERWLVAVQMVSEGVDIPRLAVGVYASTTRTQLFFQQVVGRFVRMRGGEDATTATVLIPSITPLLDFAREIELTVSEALREEADMEASREARDGAQSEFDIDEPWDSSEAHLHSSIRSGDDYPADELARARAYGVEAGMPPSVSDVDLARFLRVAERRGTGSTPVDDAPRPEPVVTLAEQKRKLTRKIQRKVNELSKETGEPHSFIWTWLNRICGEPNVRAATIETLNRRVVLLDARIATCRLVKV